MVTVSFARPQMEYEDGVRRLLESADEEFVPDLTADDRTGVSRSDGEAWFDTIEEYVAAAMERPLVVATDDGETVGMLSFEQIDEMDVLAAYTPTNYVAELVVARDHRGQGIATAMYELLIEATAEEHPGQSVSTKTWSTNHDHLSILESLGFECVERLPDDRGEGIDTVYYARAV